MNTSVCPAYYFYCLNVAVPVSSNGLSLLVLVRISKHPYWLVWFLPFVWLVNDGGFVVFCWEVWEGTHTLCRILITLTLFVGVGVIMIVSVSVSVVSFGLYLQVLLLQASFQKLKRASH